MITKYTIKDKITDELVADQFTDKVQAYETLIMLQMQFPHKDLVIEEKQFSTVKPGFGRDPDLH